MKNAHPTAILALSAAALTLAAGCASSEQRASSSPSHCSSYQDQQPQSAAVDSEGLVIGTNLSFDGVPTYSQPAKSLTLPQISNELIAMHNRDRQLVRYSIDIQQQNPDSTARVNAIDRAHTARLKEIVDYIGWPTRGTVGLGATEGAYLVIQHASGDTEFQARCLKMMHDMADRGELPAPYVALLTDRIRVFNNQPQVYGTQMTLAPDSNGVMRPTPSTEIESPEQLDERRQAMGMPAHDKFVAAIANAYAASLIEPNERFASVETD